MSIKAMRTLVVSHSLPSRSANGGPITVWSLIDELIQRGDVVTVISILLPGDRHYSLSEYEALKGLGVDIELIDMREISPRNEYLRLVKNKIPLGILLHRDIGLTYQFASRVSELAKTKNIDRAYVYHWESIMIARELKSYLIPVVGLIGDPLGLPRYQAVKYRFKTASLYNKFRMLPRLLHTCVYYFMSERLSSFLVKRCSSIVAFQSNEVSRYSTSSVGAVYSPTPISDSIKDSRLIARNSVDKRIVILSGPSNVDLTTTRAGIDFFVTHILQKLIDRYGDNYFRVRFVGGGAIPPLLQSVSYLRSVELVGRVDPPDEEFINSDIQISMTPFSLGNRVRLTTGMLYNKCIVAHSCDVSNTPEMQDGLNCLIGSTPSELFKKLCQVIDDPILRKTLGDNAYSTYLHVNASEVAAKSIIDSFNGGQ